LVTGQRRHERAARIAAGAYHQLAEGAFLVALGRHLQRLATYFRSVADIQRELVDALAREDAAAGEGLVTLDEHVGAHGPGADDPLVARNLPVLGREAALPGKRAVLGAHGIDVPVIGAEEHKLPGD